MMRLAQSIPRIYWLSLPRGWAILGAVLASWLIVAAAVWFGLAILGLLS